MTDTVEDFTAPVFKDRSQWPAGPWDEEPTDREEWATATGLPALAVRGPSGSWCGYVGIGPTHPLYGASNSYFAGRAPGLEALEVHGGITYAEMCQGRICHVPKPGEPENLYWLGFDTHHLGDRAPTDREANEWGASYKRIEYVKMNCEKLAKQLQELSHGCQ